MLRNLGIEREFAAAFLPTTPRWQAMWIQSPLPPEACRLLALIYSAQSTADYADFVHAAQRGASGAATLHFWVSPPGATFGGTFLGYTPHCPRCKADADLPYAIDWRYPTTLHVCHVCGQTYSPAETATQSLGIQTPPTLREMLTPTEYEEFLKEYYRAHGAAPEGVALAIADMEAEERRQEAELAISTRRFERQQAWVEDVLYAGLTPHRKRARGPLSSDEELVVFTEHAFATIIDRAQAKGVGIWSIGHHSAKGDRDLEYLVGEESVAVVMQRFAQNGCHDFFHASFNVPDQYLDQAP